MINKIIQTETFQWVDVSAPTIEELDSVAQSFKLHSTAVKDCLDPEHLPKYESVDEITFIIIRIFDEACTASADTIQSLTRKVAIFYTDKYVLTIHRSEQEYLKRIQTKWMRSMSYKEHPATALVSEILYWGTYTFEKPLEIMEQAIDGFETKLFNQSNFSDVLPNIYHLKRRSNVIKRMVRYVMDISGKIVVPNKKLAPVIQDLKEEAEGVFFFADELLEDINNLLSLQISLASQKTNDVMRVLTIFSVFFMPLTFIVGVYGMNFEFIPEFHWKYGYIFVWGIILAVSLGIWVWFRRKGWLT